MNKKEDLSEQLHKVLVNVRESAKSPKSTDNTPLQPTNYEELQTALRPKLIDYESAKRYIDSFEESKQKFTPEIIDAMMNGVADENFWNDKNLRQSLEDDIAFSMKVWSGFSELSEIAGFKQSKDWERERVTEELIFLCAIASRTDLPINIEARVAALKKMRDVFSDLGFPDDVLKGSVIMKLAYIGEAEAMEKFEMDWRKTPLFFQHKFK